MVTYLALKVSLWDLLLRDQNFLAIRFFREEFSRKLHKRLGHRKVAVPLASRKSEFQAPKNRLLCYVHGFELSRVLNTQVFRIMSKFDLKHWWSVLVWYKRRTVPLSFLLKPKSVIFICPSASSRRFSGFKSRYTILSRCKYSKARRISRV